MNQWFLIAEVNSQVKVNLLPRIIQEVVLNAKVVLLLVKLLKEQLVEKVNPKCHNFPQKSNNNISRSGITDSPS